MKRLITVILGATFFLSACNTMEGVGRDVEKVGHKIETKAEQAKR